MATFNNWSLKKLSHALHACVYIYIWQLSSFRASMLWFIDLIVATYYIQYTFLSLCQFFSQENIYKIQKYLKATIFVWYENSHRRLLGAQSSNTESELNWIVTTSKVVIKFLISLNLCLCTCNNLWVNWKYNVQRWTTTLVTSTELSHDRCYRWQPWQARLSVWNSQIC